MRLRLEGGFQQAQDSPSRRSLCDLLRMRASETIGITAGDTHSRHGRARPGHPDAVKRHAFPTEITGTRPVMTGDYRFLPYFAGNA